MKILKWLIGFSVLITLAFLVCLTQCTNNPWPAESPKQVTFYTNFNGIIKSLDPVVSYYQHEGEIICQIAESPLDYHYLKRPYTLRPNLVESLPEITYYDKAGNKMQESDPPAEKVGRVEYLFKIKKGIYFQPHPCFAMDLNGKAIYSNLKEGDIPDEWDSPMKFIHQGNKRELKADDFGVTLRRQCDDRLGCPVFSNLSSFILGMDECAQALREQVELANTEARSKGRKVEAYPVAIDYMKIPLKGFEKIDDYTFKIITSRKYPPAIYWFAMHFFAPMPQEAVNFFSEPLLIDRKMTVNNFPVGTGAYMLSKFDPTREIELLRNPYFRDEFYPSEGEKGDAEKGLLNDAGKKLPFTDRVVLTYEREFIPAWIKFLQGYYDNSGVKSDAFNSAVTMSANGDLGISDDMAQRGISLETEIKLGVYYFLFNMNDPVLGGYTPEKQKLRQAISILLNINEMVDIFLNGQGVQAQGVIPPSILSGAPTPDKTTNIYTDQYDPNAKKNVRLSVEFARRLLKEAGYEGGIDPSTGRPLTIRYDHGAGDAPGAKPLMIWRRKQLERGGILLEEAGTDLNRFREKLDNGNWQTCETGWLADYPDAENFLFLFYGPNGRAKYKGQNSGNYDNPEFNAIFEKVEVTSTGPKRDALIDAANALLQKDAPLCFGYYPSEFYLQHGWLKNFKPNAITRGCYMYYRIDRNQRDAKRAEWNTPILWPMILGFFALLFFITIPLGLYAVKQDQPQG